MTRPAIAVAALLVAAGLAPLGAATTATAAPPTCQGKPATVVDAPQIVGTDGPDVIVAAVATSVKALGGDDLVCVVSGKRNTNVIDVDTGDGDDVVDTTAAPALAFVRTTLGAGADGFVGGDARDVAIAGHLTDSGVHLDQDVDTITTAGGNDVVTTGEAGRPNGDSVSTGDEMDFVTFAGDPTPTTSISGDGGDNRLSWVIGAGSHTADLAAGTVTRAGAPSQATTTFPGPIAVVHLDVPDTKITIIGSEGDDDVTVAGAREGTTDPTSPRVDAALGAGDDELTFFTPPGPDSGLDGGAGTDKFRLGSDAAHVQFDLARGSLGFDGALEHTVTAKGFENAEVHARRVALLGTSAANQLWASGCRVRLVGRAGNDDLSYRRDSYWESFTWTCSPTTTMVGGKGRDTLNGYHGADLLKGGAGADRITGFSGNDVLKGGAGADRLFGRTGNDKLYGQGGKDKLYGDNGRDLLVGGRGRDLANGGGGIDTCRSAEKRRKCERR